MVCQQPLQEQRSSLYYHLTESRDRSLFLLFSFVITLSLCYVHSLELIFLYVKPFLIFEKPFIFTELTEALYITLKICVISSLCVMSPLVCYQVWCFLVPSCYPHERRRWSNVLLSSNMLAAIGWLGVYMIVLPTLAAILLQFEIKTQLITIQLEARIDSYVKWSLQVFLAMGIVCQLPLLAYLAFQLGLFNSKVLSQNRRIAFVLFLLIAAFLSPPDIFAQLITTAFLFLCFETILWLGMVFSQMQATRHPSLKRP